MKKISIIMIGVLMLFLIGCEPKEIKVGILIYDESDTFMQEFKNAIIDNLDKFSYEVVYASNSQSVQNKQIIDLVKAGIDVLVINAVDRLAASSMAEFADKHHIPVVFINREPLEADIINFERVYYVGADANSLGVRQAEAAHLIFMDPANLNPIYDKNNDNIIQTVILKGEQSHQDAEKRTRMSIEKLRELGYEVELLSTSIANWRRDLAYQKTAELFLMYDNIELILANNDDMALGAIDYLVSKGIFVKDNNDPFNQNTIIIGVDGTLVGKKAIEDGLLYASVLNDSATQGKAVATLINYVINNKEFNDFPYDMIKERYIFVDGSIILKQT